MTEFWRGRRVLLTGCVGWLGSCLTRRLVDLGARVMPCDRLTTSAPWRAQGLDLPVTLANCESVANMLYCLQGRAGEPKPEDFEGRPDVVFHLAGAAHIGICQRDPETAFRRNVIGTYGVLEACRQYVEMGGKLSAIVCASSNHTYAGGRAGKRTGFVETDQLDAADWYGTTKACSDHMARAYAHYGLPVVALRHLNAVGPFDPEPSRIGAGTILKLLAGEAPVIKSDGSPVKGYIFLDDLIDAYLHAAEIAAKGARGPYNVGGVDQTISVLGLVDRLIQASGLDVAPDVRGEDLTQSGYVEILDDSRFRATGWSPKVTLGEGLNRTWDWYVAHGGMKWTDA